MDFRKTIKGKLLGLPVLVKVMGITVGLAVFLWLAQVWQIQHSYYPLEEREVEEDTSFLAQSLGAGASLLLRHGNPAELQQLLDEGTRGSLAPFTTVRQVTVMDTNGQVLARTSPSRAQDTTSRVIERSAPLAGGQGGTLSVVLKDDHADYEVNWHKRRIALTTAIVTLVSLVVTWWIMGLVTRPLLELGQTVRQVKAGNYQARASVRAMDEIGELATAFNEMAVALQAKDALNRRLVKRLLVAGEEERKHVAHELNEQTGQALCSLVAGLSAMEGGANQERLPELRALASQTLGEVHNLSLALRPSALEELGLAAALQTLCHGLAQPYGVRVICVVHGLDNPARLPADLEVTLFRIAEEATAAALRNHPASTVELRIERKEASVITVIKYDGGGTAVSDSQAQSSRPDDLDLLAIEERARLLNGSLRVESHARGGTSLFIEIPLNTVGQPETEMHS